MTSVNCLTCQKPRIENGNTGLAHVGNAAITSAGLIGTGVLLNKGVNLAENVCGDSIALTSGYKTIRRETGKLFNFFEKMGQKIFKDGLKLGNIVERYVTGKFPTGGVMSHPEQIKAVLKKSKTVGAMAITAGVAALGLLFNGIYNAGKINGASK